MMNNNVEDYREIYCRACFFKECIDIDFIEKNYFVIQKRSAKDDNFKVNYLMKCPKCKRAVSTVNLSPSTYEHLVKKIQKEYIEKTQEAFYQRLKDGGCLEDTQEGIKNEEENYGS